MAHKVPPVQEPDTCAAWLTLGLARAAPAHVRAADDPTVRVLRRARHRTRRGKRPLALLRRALAVRKVKRLGERVELLILGARQHQRERPA